MTELWIGLGIITVVVITIIVIIEVNKHKFIQSIENQLKQHGSLEKVSKSSHQYVLNTLNKSILIRLIYAPSVNEVSFNSKRHWQLFSSSGKKMIETHSFAEIPGDKLILVYPQPGKIVKYINENEVVFVKPHMDVFGMHVIHLNQIDNYFE